MRHLAALAKRGIEVWIKPTGRLGIRGTCSPELRQQISIRKSLIIGEILLGTTNCPTCALPVMLQQFDDGIDDDWRWWECRCGNCGGHQFTPLQMTILEQGWVVMERTECGETIIITRDDSVELPGIPAVPVWTLEEVVTWLCADASTRDALVSLKTQHGGQVLFGMTCPFGEVDR